MSWKFPFGRNDDGTPKIERQMTPSQYEEYKLITRKYEERIKYSDYSVLELAPVSVDTSKFEWICQKEDYCDLPYPCKEHPERTIASSGEFLIIAYIVLKYFNKDVTLEELRDIAV